MSVIPPGTALDAGMDERLTALRRLLEGARDRLLEVQGQLSGPRARRDRRYIRARVVEAEEIIAALYRIEGGTETGALVRWAMDHFPATYGAGARMGMRDLAAQGVRAVTGDRRIHGAALESLVTNYLHGVQTDLIIPLKQSLIRTVRVVVNEAGFAEDIAAGIIGGLPRAETSAALRRTLLRTLNESLPDDAMPDLLNIQVGNRTMDFLSWSEMHARTETARASTAGNRAVCDANGVLHVQITSHAHAPCICTPYEGRIYRIHPDRGDARFGWIGEVPGGGCPMHPNCVHREAPAVVDFLEERGDVEGRTTVPADFRGLDERELARVVRANAGQLRRYSEDRDGMLPQGFRLKAAA